MTIDDGLEAGPGDDSAQPAPGRYRWVAMAVVLVGAFVVVLDSTVVNLALPALSRDFETGTGIEWVVTAYLAAVGVVQLATGWVADTIGRRRAFLIGLAVFTAASVVCTIAPDFEVLLAARVVQGLGGGLLMPVGVSIIYELFEPTERGRAMGYFGIALMVAPAAGPVLGGSVVSTIGWRWLFALNIPVGVVGLVVAAVYLRDSGYRVLRPFDGRGLVIGGAGIAVLMVGFARVGQLGWARPDSIGVVVLAAAILELFRRHALRVEHPLVDLRIFTNPVFALGMAVIGLMSVAQYSRLVYLPLELATLRSVDEFHIGLVMMPMAVAVALIMPIGGRLVDRIGARVPSTVGLLVQTSCFVMLTLIPLSTPLWALTAILVWGGLGTGLGVQAPNIQAMNAVTADQVSQAAALSSTARQLAAGVGTAAVAALFALVQPSTLDGLSDGAALRPYRIIFAVGAVVLAIAAGISLLLPGRDQAMAIQEERQREFTAGARPPG